MDSMLDYILIAGGVILALVGIFLLGKLVMFLFSNYVTTRIISLLSGGASIYFFIDMVLHFGEVTGNVMYSTGPLILNVSLYVLQWCTFVGPAVFDEYYTGEYEAFKDAFGVVHITPKTAGALFGNVLGCLVIYAALWFVPTMLGLNIGFPLSGFLSPLIALITIIGIIRRIFS